MELNRNKVLLGLSGGVDSATAALLLKEKGFSVTGYYFDVAGNNIKGRDEAAAVAEQLGIDFIYEDVSKDFGEIVIGNFIDEYLHGRTPNPCVMCNPNVKFKHLIHHADEIGAYYIATGHYCRVFHDENDGKFYIHRAVNEKKDQSYMLYRLGQEVVSRLIFPLGEFLSKDETRELARENTPKKRTVRRSVSLIRWIIMRNISNVRGTPHAPVILWIKTATFWGNIRESSIIQ